MRLLFIVLLALHLGVPPQQYQYWIAWEVPPVAPLPADPTWQYVGVDMGHISAEPPGAPDHGGANFTPTRPCWWIVARVGQRIVGIWIDLDCYHHRVILTVVRGPP